jgi:hypothetical protein
MLKIKTALPLLFCALALFSCTAKAGIELADDFSGKMMMDFSVSKDFLSVLENFQPGSSADIFGDTALLQKKLNSTAGISRAEVSRSGLNSLKISLFFSSPDKIADIKTGKNSLVFKPGKDFAERLKKTYSLDEDETLLLFLPQEGESREEYLENMDFLLGRSGMELFLKSVLKIEITAAGTISAIKNGTTDGKKAYFTLTIMDILFPADKTEYSISFTESK